MTEQQRLSVLNMLRSFDGSPQRIEAACLLDAHLADAAFMAAESEAAMLWHGRPPLPSSGWIRHATEFLMGHEGLVLDAYRCPAGVWTIGYGNTFHLDENRPVAAGDRITLDQAEEWLERSLLRHYQPAVVDALPLVATWPSKCLAALVSWTFNVGTNAMRESTLRRRLLAGEDPFDVVHQELIRWNKASGQVLAGLVRRRKDELQLFDEGWAERADLMHRTAPQNPLPVRYFSQLDSETDHGRRMCFSSSCAMLLDTMRPGKLAGANGDDAYLGRVLKYGDTTEIPAQLQALRSFGLEAEFTQEADWEVIKQQIGRGIPVPLGYLHRGHVTQPIGGGHWLCCIGYDDRGLIVHDPYGDCDLMRGGFIGGRSGQSLHYSYKNFGPRWMIEGAGTGWAILGKA